MSGGAKRNFTCTLDQDLADYVESIRAAEEMNSTAEAVRYLLRMQMAATPLDGAMIAAKLRVAEQIRRWALTKINTSLDEMMTEIKQYIPPEDAG